MFDIRVPCRAAGDGRSRFVFFVAEWTHVADDQHGRGLGTGQAVQFTWEGGIHLGGWALRERQKFGVVHEALEGRTLEVARMGQRRTPVVGEPLEMCERERLQRLSSQGHDAVVAQRVKQDGHLVGTQRRTQIDAVDSQPGAAGGQGTFAARVCAEGSPQLRVDGLDHSSWTGGTPSTLLTALAVLVQPQRCAVSG